MSHGVRYTTTVQLEITPLDTLVDEPVAIRVSGLLARQSVTLRVNALDTGAHKWMSSASFVADNNGIIDVTTQQPIAGSYHKVDPMGLFWSMQPVDQKSPALFLTQKQQAIEIELSVEINGDTITTARLKRRFASEGIESQQIREQGLVGTFAYPKHAGPVPAIIILGGSDGHIRESAAALLASHGFAALTLAYFGVEDLPPHLVHIPLEYFETAIAWLQAQDVVQNDKLGVIGLSRGGELALLLGATFPGIKAVIACSPSALVLAGIDGNNYSRSAWTYHGKPLQQAIVKFTPWLMLKLLWQSSKIKAYPMRDMFLTTLKDDKHLQEASIPVENTQGPILLISGEDDMMLPSTIFSEMVMQRLTERQHAYPDQHLAYPGAGHFVCFPYGYPFLPPMVKRVQGLAVGGSVENTASAIADSWPKMVTFLKQNLCSR